MSPRAKLVKNIVDRITGKGAFNAPYGVIEGKSKLPNGGYVRHVTFGCAATLDAVVYVWTDKRVEVEARGPLAYLFRGVSTADEFFAAIDRIGK